MKFKIYGWLGIHRDVHSSEETFEDYSFYLIPGIDIHLDKSKWGPCKDEPNGFKGAWLTIIFTWLISGLTFDFRFGDNAKEEK